MKIHEYQGKELFRKYGVTTPRGFPAFSVAEAEMKAAQKVSGLDRLLEIERRTMRDA